MKYSNKESQDVDTALISFSVVVISSESVILDSVQLIVLTTAGGILTVISLNTFEILGTIRKHVPVIKAAKMMMDNKRASPRFSLGNFLLFHRNSLFSKKRVGIFKIIAITVPTINGAHALATIVNMECIFSNPRTKIIKTPKITAIFRNFFA